MTSVQELANGLTDWNGFRWYAVAALTMVVAQSALIAGFLAQRAAVVGRKPSWKAASQPCARVTSTLTISPVD